MALLTNIADPFLRHALSKTRPTRLGRVLMLLTVRGRASGREFTFPVQYARDGTTLWVFPGEAGKKRWWRNLRTPSTVRIHLLGEDVEGFARAIAGTEEPEEATNGLTAFLERFPAAARSLDLSPHPSLEEIRHASERAVMVRIDLRPARSRT